MSQAIQNPPRVLVLMADLPVRALMVASLQSGGFSPGLCSCPQQAIALMDAELPRVLVHDWSLTDENTSIQFQQRLGRTSTCEPLIRLLIVKEITARIRALAIDCGIRRLLTPALARIGLTEEVRMAIAGEESLSEIQRKVRQLRTSTAGLSQNDIDNHVRHAFSIYSHDPMVKVEYGNLCVRQANYPQAEQIARTLLSTEPSNVRAMNLMSRALIKMGKVHDGVRWLETANELSPQNSRRLAELGSVMLAQGNRAAATGYFLTSLRLEPHNEEAAVGIGALCLSDSSSTPTLDALRKALAEDSAVGALNNAAVHAARAGRPSDALSLYQMALSIAVSDRVKCLVQFNMGLAYRRQGEVSHALESFRTALVHQPDFEKARKQLSDLSHSPKG